MILELAIFIVSIAAIVSSTDFISKSFSNITQSLGISEYISSTIILSFVISLPIFLLMFFSDMFHITTFGVNIIIGFSIAMITIVMGVFLLKNEVAVEQERFRNTTFMWASSILFFVVILNNMIDRLDAIFLLSLFSFYCLYIYYRTKKSKEYVYLRIKKTNVLLFIPALIAIAISSFVVVMLILMTPLRYVAPVFLPLVILSFALVLPMFDIIKNVFKSAELTFDNLIGNVVVTLTFIPGIIALYRPIPFLVGTQVFLSLILLNLICLTFAVMTRFKKTIGRGTGIFLIVTYFLFAILVNFI